MQRKKYVQHGLWGNSKYGNQHGSFGYGTYNFLLVIRSIHLTTALSRTVLETNGDFSRKHIFFYTYLTPVFRVLCKTPKTGA